MSVLLIVLPKCTLATSHAAPWWITMSMCRCDRQTDGRQTVSSRFPLDAISVIWWKYGRKHGAVAQRVERGTRDQQVVGSNPTRGKSCVKQLWASCSHLCASVTKQYYLVPTKGRWCSAAGKVTAGLTESNYSLPPGWWLIVTCGLTGYTLGSASGPIKAWWRVWEAFIFFTFTDESLTIASRATMDEHRQVPGSGMFTSCFVLLVQRQRQQERAPAQTLTTTATRTPCWGKDRRHEDSRSVDVANDRRSSTHHCPTPFKSASSDPEIPTTMMTPFTSYLNIKVWSAPVLYYHACTSADEPRN